MRSTLVLAPLSLVALVALAACASDKPKARGRTDRNAATAPTPGPAPAGPAPAPAPATEPEVPPLAVLSRFNLSEIDSPLAGQIPVVLQWTSAGEGVVYDVTVDPNPNCSTTPATHPDVADLKKDLGRLPEGTHYLCVVAKRAGAYSLRAQNSGIEVKVPKNAVPKAGTVKLTDLPIAFVAGQALQIGVEVTGFQDPDLDEAQLDLDKNECKFEVVKDAMDPKKYTLKSAAMGDAACELKVNLKDAGGLCKGCTVVTKRLAALVFPKDVNAVVNKGAFADGTSPTFTLRDGKVLFAASTDLLGRELWISDKTADGTKLVKDVSPGGHDADVQLLGGNDTVVFFLATTLDKGRELWKTDGTADGTVLVKDINPGAASSNVTEAVMVGAELVFFADGGQFGTELWSSDGTEGGTAMVKDITAGANGSTLSSLVSMGGKAYFVNSGKLWKSDTTEAGTAEALAAHTSVTNLVAGLDRLFFSAVSAAAASQAEPYVSDGATATLMSNLNAGTASSPRSFTVGNTRVYFVATIGGVPKIHSAITPFTTVTAATSTATAIDDLTAVGDDLFFYGTDATNGAEPWYVDSATPGAAAMVTNIAAGATSSRVPGARAVLGTNVYFSANDATSGNELWKTDGTSGGTVRVKDIRSGAPGSSPQALFTATDKILFTADPGEKGRELFITDGTEANTAPLKDIETATKDALSGTTAGPVPVPGEDGVVIFAADDGTGAELWRSDGTATGTELVADLHPSSGTGSNPAFFTTMGGMVYFSGTDTAGTHLYRTDGKKAGTTSIVASKNFAASGEPRSLVALPGNVLVYSADDGGGAGRELWRAEGNTVAIIQDLIAGATGSDPRFLTVGGSTVYYIANVGANATLRSSTGNVGASTQLKAFNLLSATELIVIGTRPYVIAADATSVKVFRGNDAGTDAPAIAPASGTTYANPERLFGVESGLYFTAESGTGRKLFYAKPGDPAALVGTDYGTNPVPLAANGAFLYFAARGSDGKYRLWKAREGSDVSQIGTMTFRSIGSEAYANNGKYYFAADDGTTGNELWATDGTAAGTQLQAEIIPGQPGLGGAPSGFVLTGGKLFMRATAPGFGRELWVLKP